MQEGGLIVAQPTTLFKRRWDSGFLSKMTPFVNSGSGFPFEPYLCGLPTLLPDKLGCEKMLAQGEFYIGGNQGQSGPEGSKGGNEFDLGPTFEGPTKYEGEPPLRICSVLTPC